ncbi:MAG: outer membrane homotrimeric porin [Desulfovibrio sp.]|nr:outer membrane homotrimeric porin [Desulfovibrio sp.]
MKRIAILLLAAGMLLGATSGAGAIDFKMGGEWLMGFSVGEANLVNKQRTDRDIKSRHANADDMFSAAQRLRLKLEAIASESLSGTVYFEIGTTTWGRDESGGALGADRTNTIKLKNAYLDWAVPSTDLKFRMGLQGITLPNKAGGSAVFDTDVAGIVASYRFNDNVGLTALWMRPFNDNYSDRTYTDWNDRANRVNYLDNMDLFALMLPVTLDGFEITPWAMYGLRGKNSGNFDAYQAGELGDGLPRYTFSPNPHLNARDNFGSTSKAYGSMFWAGLPFAVTAWDPLNIEVDLNYGHVEGMGRFNAFKRRFTSEEVVRRSSSQRQGWAAKALIEYKTDWGTPGIFGWYASGDDGNPKNGSERMPSIAAYGNFTSFLGDGNLAWTPNGSMLDYNSSFGGTWGIGARVKDVSFVDDLKHTLTVAWWGGTNSPAMVKYMHHAYDWNNGFQENYLTTRDGLLEVNLVNSWQIYENLAMNLELGYVANFIDNSTWRKTNGDRATSFQKQDMWKAQAIFAYSF